MGPGGAGVFEKLHLGSSSYDQLSAFLDSVLALLRVEVSLGNSVWEILIRIL